MSPITFKFFSPRGDCRRVTYEDLPELATINELVDGMVEGRRTLSYRDSEGDIVLLKTSRDVVEAVKDAKDSGAKSIKVQIRLVRECPRNTGGKAAAATAANANNSNHRNQCGAGRRANNCHRPQWGRCWSAGRGLFGYPHPRINIDLEGVSDEVDELVKHFAPLFGIHMMNETDGGGEKAKKAAGERASSGSQNQPPKEDEHPAASQPQETAQQVEETKTPDSAPATPVNESAAASPSPVPTIEESVKAENPDASGFTFVENGPQDDKAEETLAPPEPKQNATDVNDDQPKPDAMDEKLKLLKEMGFDLPESVAKNMIRELNGRMDLIVRALVANQK